MPETGPVNHAAADRQHILDRTANFGADHIVRIVRSEARFRDQRVEPVPQVLTFAGQGQGGGQALRHFMGKGWTGQDRQRIVRPQFRGDLAHQHPAFRLDTLAA